MPQIKLGTPSGVPQLSNPARREKYFALSVPRSPQMENCSPLGADNFRGQISEHIFAPNLE